ADLQGAMGILGAIGAMEIPMVSREIENLVSQDPRIIELNEKIRNAETREDQDRLTGELKTMTEQLRKGDYANLMKDFWALVNTPERAKKVGSIDEVILDTNQTRRILIEGLRKIRTQVEERKTSEAAYRAARDQVTGLATLFGLPYQWMPNGQVELTINQVTFRADPRAIAEGIQGMVNAILPQIRMGDLTRLGEYIQTAQ